MSETTIVSQEHDLDKIRIELPDFEQNLQRQIDSLNWDAAEYGISRDDAIARLRAADTPEAREKVVQSLRAMAQQRASLDTSNGRVAVMSAGQLPWHGLGVVVEQAANSKEAIVLAGQDWPVEKVPLRYRFNDVEIESPESFALIRTDTGKQLGTVGSRYEPIQNVDGYGFIDDVLAEYGARYETAGSIYGGKKIWLLAHLPKQAFKVNGKDEQQPYVLFTNAHDGTAAAACYPTAVRVVCANTYRVSGKDRKNGINIRHTGSIRSKIAAAQRVLGIAVSQFDNYKEACEVLSRKVVPIRSFANSVLDKVLDVTAEQVSQGAQALARAIAETEEVEAETRKFERKIQLRFDVLEDILERYDSAPNNVNGMGGTAWAAFNAFTDYADHNRIRRYKGSDLNRLSRKFESAISGEGDYVKQVAFEQALALAV